MNIIMMLILAVAGGVIYTFLNVITRRLVAGVRSREDYDEDVDGTMTEEEKKASEEAKIIETEYKKIQMKAVWEESKIRFIIVIILGIILSGLAGFHFGLSPETFIFAVFYALLVMISLVDIATMEIPPQLNYIILGLGIISVFTTPEITWLERLIGAVSVSGFLLLIAIIVKGGFGGGDIKLMFAAGVLLGWKGVLTAFLVGIVIGAIVGVLSIIISKKGFKSHIPLGPSLCVGLVVASIWQTGLIDWYWNIIKMSMPNTFGN